jgi:hypothetical protein
MHPSNEDYLQRDGQDSEYFPQMIQTGVRNLEPVWGRKRHTKSRQPLLRRTADDDDQTFDRASSAAFVTEIDVI